VIGNILDEGAAMGSCRRFGAGPRSGRDELDMLNRGVLRADLSCRKVGLLIGTVSLLCAISVWFSWQQDKVALRQHAAVITKNLSTDSARIHAINDWVYQNKGFAKNYRYFIVPALGPTPIQVMERGGDCADKSRLVAAMLNSLNIDAGLIMISQCPRCGFIHTVVEAEYENGRMVVDPTWDVDYPTGDGRFFGVRELAGTDRGRERIIELQRQRPINDRIMTMPPDEATFDYAVSMNWDRDIVTRSVAAVLRLGGYSTDTLFRPIILEDPKLFFVCLLIGIATASVIGGFLMDLGLRSLTRQIRQPVTVSNTDKLEVRDA
jgi:Transglutaminase-like superfamily